MSHRWTVGEVLGTGRFWVGLGQSYADAIRTGASASAIIASAAKYLGLSAWWAVALGATAFCLWPTLALGFGYLVWRYKLVHAEMERQLEVNPASHRQLALLTQIETNTRPNALASYFQSLP
jgi:hypothetical protein